MKGLVFGIVLASVGVAAMAGGAVARNVGGHGGHGGAGPAWPTPIASPTCRAPGIVPAGSVFPGPCPSSPST